MSKRITTTAIGAALLMPSLAHGETSDEISAIRRELESMREAYEVRLRELEGRLEQAEARAREQDPATAPLVEAQQAFARGDMEAFAKLNAQAFEQAETRSGRKS